MTIQKLATLYASYFVRGKRSNGKYFIKVRDEINDENLKNLIYEAHSGLLPDDFKYQFIIEALEAIAESDNEYDIQLEPDCYHHDLLNWVSSNLTRAYYVDKMVNEIGYQDFYSALANGQLREKEKVLSSVLHSLNALIEEE